MPSALLEAGAAGAFDVGKNLEPLGDAEAGVERLDPRRGVFAVGQKAVRAGVFGVEGGLLLADEIRLRRDPEAIPEGFSAPSDGIGRTGILSKEKPGVRIRTARRDRNALLWLGTCAADVNDSSHAAAEIHWFCNM